MLGSSTASVIIEFVLQSNSRSGIGSTDRVFKLFFRTYTDSMKQCVEPESTRALNFWFGTRFKDKLTTREFGEKRVEALILTSPFAQNESTRPSVCAGFPGSRTSFLRPKPYSRLCHRTLPRRKRSLPEPTWLGGIRSLGDHFVHISCRVGCQTGVAVPRA